MTHPRQPEPYPGDQPLSVRATPQQDDYETKPGQPEPYPGDAPVDPEKLGRSLMQSDVDDSTYVFPRVFQSFR